LQYNTIFRAKKFKIICELMLTGYHPCLPHFAPRREDAKNYKAIAHHQFSIRLMFIAATFKQTQTRVFIFCISLLILRVIAHRAISLRESLGVFASWRETALKDNPFIFVSTHNCDIAFFIARNSPLPAPCQSV
jgi:hypothetical protein